MVGTREARRWIRSWWADQMRNPTVPDVPAHLDNEDFFEVWADESARIAQRITARDQDQ